MRRRYQSTPIPTIFSHQDSPTTLFGFNSSGNVGMYFRLRYLIIIPIIYLFAGLFLDNLWRGVDANSYSVLLGFSHLQEFQAEYFKQATSTSPAYYRLLEFGALLFGNWLDNAISMRITNALLILTGTVALYRTIRLVYPPDVATVSAIATVTCLGGLELFHLSTAGVGSYFAISISIYGIALSLRKIYGGVIMGLGFVLSIMMGSGTLLPTLIPAIFLLFIRRENNNHPERIKIYRIAMLLAASMIGITLINFFVYTGRTAIEANLWLPLNNINSFSEWLASSSRFIWFCMPLWPALIGFRNFARKQWSEQSIHLLILGGVGALTAFPLSFFSVNAPLMILPFLCLLYTPAILLLPIQWQRASYWFYFLFFTIVLSIVLLIRLLWAFDIDSSGNQLVTVFITKRFPSFDNTLSAFSIISSSALLFLWFFWSLFSKKYFTWIIRPTISWIIGMCCLWLLLMVLWMPAVNYSKSYLPAIKTIMSLTTDSCVKVKKAPFAFRVNWAYFTKNINKKSTPQVNCKYKLTTQKKTNSTNNRKSILITDKPSEIINKEDNQLENKTITDDTKKQTKSNLVPKWIEINRYSRPGEKRYDIVLHKQIN